MGTTAEKIARHVAAQTKAPVIDLAGHRQMKQLLRDAKLDTVGFARRISEGTDPCYAVYTHAQALISIMAEQLAATKEARQFARHAAEAEDIYMPSYPPMSPVTASHFAMWSLFDLQFGQSHETIGTCFLRIAELTDLPAGLRATVSALQSSRLGLYVHCGHEGRFVRLREIGLERIERCHVPAGYRGEAGEIWLARLLPPASTLFDYHVVSTTPYVIDGGSESVWLAYLDRERRRLRNKPLPHKIDATTYIMKHGPSINHWNEYIFCAYAGHRAEAVFLTGIPDDKASLPHA